MLHQRRRASVTLALTFLALLAAPGAMSAQETQDTMRLPAALRTARAGLTGAYTALNASAASQFYADSATVNFQGQVFTGRSAIEAWLVDALQGLSAIRFAAPTFVVSENEVSERGGYTVALPDGTEQPGSAETVWRRQSDGSWKVMRLTVS
jgi:ketosteroid isomerase-like protein